MQLSNAWTQVLEIEIIRSLSGNTIRLWFKQLKHGVYLWKILIQNDNVKQFFQNNIRK